MAEEIRTQYHNSYWCDFSEPINLGTELNPDWHYSKLLCENPAFYEFVEHSTTGAYFWVNQTFSYGDFFIMGFLTICLLVGIAKIIWDNIKN